MICHWSDDTFLKLALNSACQCSHLFKNNIRMAMTHQSRKIRRRIGGKKTTCSSLKIVFHTCNFAYKHKQLKDYAMVNRIRDKENGTYINQIKFHFRMWLPSSGYMLELEASLHFVSH